MTNNQETVIRAYMKDDFVGDFGWESEEAAAWLPFHADCNMDKNVFAGTLSQMVQDGIAWTNGEAFGLTEKGIEFARTLS